MSTTHYKLCARPECKLSLKPTTDFGADKNRPDGLNPYCKTCVIEMSAEAYQRRQFTPDLDKVEKWCAGHKRMEPIENFGRHKKSTDGYRNVCREYNNQKLREYKRSQKEQRGN